ncbi:TPA: DUF1080 domain-containing protein [Candidatus Poribacteria bacterium]|nr:DUF1080 domain-containing protein [Candidatus Poribacteria bacterium]
MKWKCFLFVILITALTANLTEAQLWKDNFKSKDSKWVEASGVWDIEDGTYKQTSVSDADNVFRAIFHSGWKLQDGTASVKIKLGPTQSNINTGCLLYRMVDDNNGYASCLHLLDKRVTIAKVIGGKYELEKSADIPLKSDVWYTLKVTLVDSHITVFVDGQEVLNHDDNSYHRGWVGVGVIRTHSPTYFDDISVSMQAPVSPHGKLAEVWGRLKKKR